MYIIFYNNIFNDKNNVVIRKNKIYKSLAYENDYVKIMGEDNEVVAIDLSSNNNSWCFYKGETIKKKK